MDYCLLITWTLDNEFYNIPDFRIFLLLTEILLIHLHKVHTITIKYLFWVHFLYFTFNTF